MKDLNHTELTQAGGGTFQDIAYFSAGGLCGAAMVHVYHEKKNNKKVPFFDKVVDKLGDAQEYLHHKADEYLPKVKSSLVDFRDMIFGSND